MQYRQQRGQKKTFQEFEAAALFCPKCKEAVPVRKRLLLTLPQGDKYDYYCSVCGSLVGGKLDSGVNTLTVAS